MKDEGKRIKDKGKSPPGHSPGVIDMGVAKPFNVGSWMEQGSRIKGEG